MDLFEVLELWHLADQVIVELFSIYLAGTFALLIAAFSAGPGLRGFVLFLATSAYLVFAFVLGLFIWGNFERVRFLDELARSLAGDRVAQLADAYYYSAGAAYAFVGIIVLMSAGTLVASYLIRHRSQGSTRDDVPESVGEGMERS